MQLSSDDLFKKFATFVCKNGTLPSNLCWTFETHSFEADVFRLHAADLAFWSTLSKAETEALEKGNGSVVFAAKASAWRSQRTHMPWRDLYIMEYILKYYLKIFFFKFLRSLVIDLISSGSFYMWFRNFCISCRTACRRFWAVNILRNILWICC